MKVLESPKGTSAGNLREVVNDYLTNGKYDPRKSQFKAEDNKNKLKTIEERRKENAKRSALIFANIKQLVDKIMPHPSNVDHFKSLPAPQTHTSTNLQNLRTPGALTQTNKLQGKHKSTHNKKRSNVSYGEHKLIHPHSRIKPSPLNTQCDGNREKEEKEVMV